MRSPAPTHRTHNQSQLVWSLAFGASESEPKRFELCQARDELDGLLAQPVTVTGGYDIELSQVQ